MAIERPSTKRLITGCMCLVLMLVIWIPGGDVIDMIIRQKEIVFGRYSRGHAAGLILLSLLLLGAAALCFSKIRTIGEMFAVSVMVIVSSSLSIFVLVIGSAWATKARYVEEVVVQEGQEGVVKGLVRHRPPNEFYQLVQEDKPEQKRSYPDAPPGYPAFNLTLTTDANGFRNHSSLAEYPVVAVGDSFVAGSHVSDEQAWVSLFSTSLDVPVYNLGVSGSDPGTYYNNFYLLGRKYKPRVVLFMIYEGNDFKSVSPIVSPATLNDDGKRQSKEKTWGEEIETLAVASPVTRGLRRFSSEVLEKIGNDCPVAGYEEHVGWMPLELSMSGRQTAYAFEPKRLVYLHQDKERFRHSESWKNVRNVMEKMVELGEQEGFTVMFIYAPSTPHVVMPLAAEKIPANQLYNFMAFQTDHLPAPDQLKASVFASMDNEENVFLETCEEKRWSCLALTKALQEATREGMQVYYSYDQHWTPEGNRVAAAEISSFYRKHFLP